MKITDRLKRKETAFRYVEAGTVFKYMDVYFLATVEVVEDKEAFYNCVQLDSGEHNYFEEDNMVEVLEAELIVK